MLYGGIIVAKKVDEKVINLFSNHNSKCIAPEVQQKVKFYAGFNYVKLKRDDNGNRFNKEKNENNPRCKSYPQTFGNFSCHMAAVVAGGSCTNNGYTRILKAGKIAGVIQQIR